ncbi:hypothetical protein TWF718_002652 [Orbilia javanica]|uniref:Uncharacterized protein n=1 Tax=Orbilia javanica TaxID=47235 RepID=A0AAN8RJX5_9PEZI
MEDKENNIHYNIITSPGSSVFGSPPPPPPPPPPRALRAHRLALQPAKATTTTATRATTVNPASISDISKRLSLTAVSGPSSALLTTNPATFIKDAFKTSIEIWSPQSRAWIRPEALQCPILKFALQEGKIIVFVSGRVDKAADRKTFSKVPSYALVWPARSVASWARDIHWPRLSGGYMEVSFAIGFLETPQLIAFGGGNARPIVLRPQQLSARFDYLRCLADHVKTVLKGGSAAWLRFFSSRPVHPSSKTLVNMYSIPGMLSCSTNSAAIAGTPPPTPTPDISTTSNSDSYDLIIQHVGADGADDMPVDPEPPTDQREQDDIILIDLLEPTPESSPAVPLAPSTLADLVGVRLGPSPLPPLPPSPPLTTYTEGLVGEPVALAALNRGLVSSVTLGDKAYHEALKKKQEYLEKLWLQCTEEIERMTVP